MKSEGHRPSPPISDEQMLSALSASARAIVEDGAAEPTPGAWYRLQRRLQTTRHRGSVPRWSLKWLIAVASAAGAAGVVLLCVNLVRPRLSVLTFAVQGGTVDVARGLGDAIQSVAASGTSINFSDGSHVALTGGAKVSVVSTNPRGARLRMDSGHARFQVMHRPRAAWAVEIGPYTIDVTGTVFDVRWSATDEALEVILRSGSVRVTSRQLAEPVALRAGQRLTALAVTGEVHIENGDDSTQNTHRDRQLAKAPHLQGDGTTSIAAAHPPSAPLAGRSVAIRTFKASPRTGPGGRDPGWPPAPAAPGSTPALPAVPTVPPPLAPPSVTPPPSGGSPPTKGGRPVALPWAETNWATRVAAGDSTSVLVDAERIGFERALADADSESLAALGDAARYSARTDLAARLLMEQRRRFPGTARAREAAFLLGRIKDDGGDPAAGMRWYRTYLQEAPKGAYAADAMGRLMLITEDIQGTAAAQLLAREYLLRFPNGTYLLGARAILDKP